MLDVLPLIFIALLTLFSPSAALVKSRDIKMVRKIESIMLSGIIAIDVVILQGFIVSTPADFPSKLTLLSFAIAIPLLGIGIFLNQSIWEAGYQAASIINYNVLKVLGVIGSFAGLTAAFWHASWWIGLIFLVSEIGGSTIAVIYITQLLRLDASGAVVIKVEENK
jgi:hypothetical protein